MTDFDEKPTLELSRDALEGLVERSKHPQVDAQVIPGDDTQWHYPASDVDPLERIELLKRIITGLTRGEPTIVLGERICFCGEPSTTESGHCWEHKR